MVFVTLLRYSEQVANVPCAPLCERTGYRDDWQAMSTIRDGKFYLSLCVCIQLLKVIKFISALVPKMGLAPSVLKKSFADLVFFGIVFFISLAAFSQMFFIQLGPFINDYATQRGAVVATARALFGDFDIDEIMDNSSGYANILLFILYLFIAVFVMLSMFFAILGESQANFRDDQRDARANGTLEAEYGVISDLSVWFSDHVLLNVPGVGARMKEQRASTRRQQVLAQRRAAPQPVDRIEARQLELHCKIDRIGQSLAELAKSQQTLQAAMAGGVLEGRVPKAGRNGGGLKGKLLDGRSSSSSRGVVDAQRSCSTSGSGKGGTRDRPPSRKQSPLDTKDPGAKDTYDAGSKSPGARQQCHKSGLTAERHGILKARGAKLEEQPRRMERRTSHERLPARLLARVQSPTLSA